MTLPSVYDVSLDEIRAGLEAGWTLPASWYTDPAVHELELERIFGRSWQFAGHDSLLRNPGDHITCVAGRIPIVVLRDLEGELRAYVNICSHRGHPVVLESGCRKSLQCMYHGWTYGLDGSLRKAPRSETDPTFDPSGLGLTPVAVDTWGPLVFVNPDLDAEPLAEALAGMPAEAERRGFDLRALPVRGSRSHTIECNWKLTLDNNAEGCYHCATLHPSFSSAYYVDSEHYLLKGFPQSFMNESPPKPGTDNDDLYHLYYLWPNTMMSARGGMYWYLHVYLPDGPHRTVQTTYYFSPPDWSEEELEEHIEFQRGLQKEDWDAWERQHVNYRSGRFDRGRVLLEEERLLRQFELLVAESVLGG
jgi:phenylpropionate dioxygenase-like ring-hydroxylating dioxygenase large terminal subunit